MADAGGERQQEGPFGGMMFRMVMMYMLFNMFVKPKPPEPKNEAGIQLPPFSNAWPRLQSMDLRVYLSEKEEFGDFDSKKNLVWMETHVAYSADAASERTKNISIKASERLMNNGTMYAHIFISKSGSSPDPGSEYYEKEGTIVKHHPLVKYHKMAKKKKLKNLISGEYEGNLTEESAAEADKEEPKIINMWKPSLTINLVEDFTVYPRTGIPPQIADHLNISKETHKYMPVLYVNEFWLMQEHMIPINDTTPKLNLTLNFAGLSLMKWQLTQQMEQSMKVQGQMHGGEGGDMDELKRMLTDTNPYLLGLTAVVSVLHMVFDCLAFKNDISFWKNNKSMEGLSLNSVFSNVFFQIVIFLYLCDNDTSWMILFSAGIGTLIEIWKLQKACSVEVDRSGKFPKLKFTPKTGYTNSATKMHDEEAMKYLSYLLYPLLVGYTIYSLFYDTHKSWYSWLLGSVVGVVYTFGFIMMTPQLFINYKLKSTAHMPWRTLMYKALNTFIDDLFAFIIRMPTMHRLSCFRDDLVFFIYIYQRWQYGVDKSRPNEYGQCEPSEPEPAPITNDSADKKAQ